MGRKPKQTKITVAEALNLLKSGEGFYKLRGRLLTTKMIEEVTSTWSRYVIDTLQKEIKPKEDGDYIEDLQQACDKNNFFFGDAKLFWDKHLADLEKKEIKVLYYYDRKEIHAVKVEDISLLKKGSVKDSWSYGYNINHAFQSPQEVIDNHKKYIEDRIKSYQEDLDNLMKCSDKMTVTTEQIDSHTFVTTSYFPIYDPESLGRVVLVSGDRRVVCHKKPG